MDLDHVDESFHDVPSHSEKVDGAELWQWSVVDHFKHLREWVIVRNGLGKSVQGEVREPLVKDQEEALDNSCEFLCLH